MKRNGLLKTNLQFFAEPAPAPDSTPSPDQTPTPTPEPNPNPDTEPQLSVEERLRQALVENEKLKRAQEKAASDAAD